MDDPAAAPPVPPAGATEKGRPVTAAAAASGRRLPLALVGLIILVLAFAPMVAGADAVLVEIGVLVAFALASWTFGFLPEPLTTLVFFLLAVVFHVAKPDVVFSGFASTAWWLVFGGSITAVAVEMTGLGRRLAGLLFGRAGGSYARAVTAVALAAVGLAFVMPSTVGRIFLLMPIVLAFAKRLGLTPERRGWTGLVLTLATASFMPTGTILPANVANSILLGAADQLYGVKLTYGPYFLLHFPLLGAAKTGLLIWLICRLFPERDLRAASLQENFGPMSRAERRLSAILLLSLALFATDFIHGISPAWISLGAGILCLLPGMEVISAKSFSERANLATLLYIAGILGIAAVVTDSGLSQVVSTALMRLAHLTPGRPAINVAALGTIGAGLGLLTTLSALPAVMTPLAGRFAAATGLPVLSVLMLEVVIFTTVLLPIEAPPIMVALQLGGVSVRAGVKFCLALAALTIVLLLPLDFLWWRLLGYLP